MKIRAVLLAGAWSLALVNTLGGAVAAFWGHWGVVGACLLGMALALVAVALTEGIEGGDG